jgi:hypothetical protein
MNRISKKQIATQNIIDTYNRTLKNNLVKNLVKNINIGFITASQLYLDKINNGCTLEELKEFIELNLKNKDLIEKVK